MSVLLVLVLSQGIEDFEAFGMEQCKKRHMQNQTLSPDQNMFGLTTQITTIVSATAMWQLEPLFFPVIQFQIARSATLWQRKDKIVKCDAPSIYVIPPRKHPRHLQPRRGGERLHLAVPSPQATWPDSAWISGSHGPRRLNSSRKSCSAS